MSFTDKYSNEERQEFARTVLNQLGGRAIVSALIGVKQITVGEIDERMQVAIKFKCKAANKANYIVITLESNDLYKVDFKSIRGLNVKEVSSDNGLYDTMLKSFFEEQTKLYLSF